MVSLYSHRFVLKDKYAVATAAGCKEALKYLADNPINLILHDIKCSCKNIYKISAYVSISNRMGLTSLFSL